jgi:hypothetical protein
MATIQKILSGDEDFVFDQSGKCCWKNIFDLMYKKDGVLFKKRFKE